MLSAAAARCGRAACCMLQTDVSTGLSAAIPACWRAGRISGVSAMVGSGGGAACMGALRRMATTISHTNARLSERLDPPTTLQVLRPGLNAFWLHMDPCCCCMPNFERMQRTLINHEGVPLRRGDPLGGRGYHTRCCCRQVHLTELPVTLQTDTPQEATRAHPADQASRTQQALESAHEQSHSMSLVAREARGDKFNDNMEDYSQVCGAWVTQRH